MSVKNLQVDKTTLLTNFESDSKFTFQNLYDLNDAKTSYKLPLSVIGFIDQNAFFAQCEQIRLGLGDNDPVVCAQWQSLIAVSYAARKFGINRMDTIQSAKSKCPNLIIAHAAAFKKGETHWQYIKGLPDQTIYKVSLDPYRRELRKILKILYQNVDLVEKASVDESYIDFGRSVLTILFDYFPFLNAKYDDLNIQLPPLPESLPSELYWIGELIKSESEIKSHQFNETLSDSQKLDTKPIINDWDDILILIGSQILYQLRMEIFEKLGYTTSGGVARNKRIAKLAGGFKKPDMQTIIRNASINRFLNNFELNDITGMGGKTGDLIISKFDIPPSINSITYLRENFTLKQITEELSNDIQLSTRVYQLVRGEYIEELQLRTMVKSMMSRKNFPLNKPVATVFDAFDWIKVFVGDLYSRLIEIDDENLNLSMSQLEIKDKGFIMRPKTLAVQITTTTYSHVSKTSGLPISRSLEKVRDSMVNVSFRSLMELLDGTNVSALNDNRSPKTCKVSDPDDVLKNYKIMPLANISVVISNFIKTTDSNLIDSYVNGKNKSDALSTQENIKKMFDEVNQQQQQQNSESLPPPPPQSEPKNKIDKSYIDKLFKDYNKSLPPLSSSPTIPSSAPAPAPQKLFKEDKSYINKLFEDFETDRQINKALSESPKKDTSKDLKPSSSISESISFSNNKESTNVKENDLLQQLIKNRHCHECQIPVEDVFEHLDYHYAKNLSEKLNGESNSSKNNGEGIKKRKTNKGQAQLPF